MPMERKGKWGVLYYIETLKFGHLELLVRASVHVNEFLDVGDIIDTRFDSVVSGKPEAIVSKDARPPNRLVDIIHGLCE
jgi:hypothetical protein